MVLTVSRLVSTTRAIRIRRGNAAASRIPGPISFHAPDLSTLYLVLEYLVERFRDIKGGIFLAAGRARGSQTASALDRSCFFGVTGCMSHGFQILFTGRSAGHWFSINLYSPSGTSNNTLLSSAKSELPGGPGNLLGRTL